MSSNVFDTYCNSYFNISVKYFKKIIIRFLGYLQILYAFGYSYYTK